MAKALGLQVRAFRQAKGWTLEQAAEKGDMDLKHWQKIEAGTINVTLVTLVRLAEGLGESVGSLFGTPIVPTNKRTRGIKTTAG
ncbi:MAG: helix-turn-helix transcriptional regulator [Polyangia bacterium]